MEKEPSLLSPCFHLSPLWQEKPWTPPAETVKLYHKWISVGMSQAPLWWSVSCVSLTGLRKAKIPDKTLFGGVSVMVFLEEISIWISRLSKEHRLPSEMLVGIIHLWRSWIEQKGRGKMNFPSVWAWTSIFSALAYWFLGLQNQTGSYIVGSFGSQGLNSD